MEPYLTNKQLQACTKCSLTKEPCTGYISSYIRCTTLYLVAEEGTGSQFRGAYSYITIMSNFIGSYIASRYAIFNLSVLDETVSKKVKSTSESDESRYHDITAI